MVTISETGKCTFRVYLPNAGGIEVLGSFNNWTAAKGHALQLSHGKDGWWSGTTPLPPGEHEFCYLVDGQIWMPDYAAGGIRRNASGRWISLVVIPEEPIAELKSQVGVGDRPVGIEAYVGAAEDNSDVSRSRERRRQGRGAKARVANVSAAL